MAVGTVPPLRIPLCDASGNIRTNADSLSLADLAALLGLNVPQDFEWVAEPGYGQPQIDVAWNGFSYLQGSLPSGPTLGAVWTLFGTFPKVTKAGRQENWLKVLTGAASACMNIFRPITGQVEMLDFFDTLSPTISAGVSSTVRIPRAYQISAEISKVLAGDVIFPRFWFGFCNITDAAGNGFARRSNMIGLVGDGAGGFQFASVNCPTASNNPGDPSMACIVSNATQPGSLVTPGTSGFWVTIKMVPPVPGVSNGQVASYLGNTRVALVSLPAAFPQFSVSSIDVANAQYFGIQPAIVQYPNQDGVTIDPGVLLRDIRYKVTSNLDVGATLQT